MIHPSTPVSQAATNHPLSEPLNSVKGLGVDANASESEMKEVFQEFVGKTLFGQLLASMHKTHSEAAYFHGGRGEEIFQQQLDQVFVEEITEASAGRIADPMFELFHLNRQA